MARVLKPPTPITLADDERAVFLAGSIEMGRAEDWQAQVERALDDLPVVVLNPRRDAWDASWEQSITNPLFRGQVEWELEGLEHASVVAMYFAPTTQAPITLLELGLLARSGRLVVCCPPGFWRRGNVEVVCARYGVPLVAGLPELVQAVRSKSTPSQAMPPTKACGHSRRPSSFPPRPTGCHEDHLGTALLFRPALLCSRSEQRTFQRCRDPARFVGGSDRGADGDSGSTSGGHFRDVRQANPTKRERW